MWQTLIAFVAGLFSGLKARAAAKAGSELPQSEAQAKKADANVTAIEAELKRSAPVAE